jgi:hypothetical protein
MILCPSDPRDFRRHFIITDHFLSRGPENFPIRTPNISNTPHKIPKYPIRLDRIPQMPYDSYVGGPKDLMVAVNTIRSFFSYVHITIVLYRNISIKSHKYQHLTDPLGCLMMNPVKQRGFSCLSHTYKHRKSVSVLH